jgi:hypothetical protein
VKRSLQALLRRLSWLEHLLLRRASGIRNRTPPPLRCWTSGIDQDAHGPSAIAMTASDKLFYWLFQSQPDRILQLLPELAAAEAGGCRGGRLPIHGAGVQSAGASARWGVSGG